MSPKTNSLVFLANPAPGTGGDEDIGSVHSQWNDHDESNETPHANDEADKCFVRQLLAPYDKQKSVEGDGKHEQTGSGVTDLKPKTLQEARSGTGLDLVGNDPFEADKEGKGLLKVCQDQVVNQDNILVVTDISLVVSSPEEQSVGNEGEKTSRGKE